MYRVIFSFWKCPWKVCSAFRCTKMFHFSVGTAGSTSTTRGRGEEETAAHSRAQPKSCRGRRLPAAMVSPGCRKLNCVLVAKCTTTVLHTVASDRILRLKMHCKGRVWRLCGFVMWPFLEDLVVSGDSTFPRYLNSVLSWMFQFFIMMQCYNCWGVPGPKVRMLFLYPLCYEFLNNLGFLLWWASVTDFKPSPWNINIYKITYVIGLGLFVM